MYFRIIIIIIIINYFYLLIFIIIFRHLDLVSGGVRITDSGSNNGGRVVSSSCPSL